MNISSLPRIPCFLVYVPDVKYDTDYTQAYGKVIREYDHHRNGCFHFFDLNFWAKTHRTEKDCRCLQYVQNSIQNGRKRCAAEVIHRAERLSGEHVMSRQERKILTVYKHVL